MDAAQALADLTEISSQIEAAVLFEESGAVLGTTLPDERAGEALAKAGGELLAGAAAFRSDGGAITQLEVSSREGSVFVVRDGEHRIAAVTAASPTVGLVFYDLKSCLRSATAEPEKPKRPRRRKEAEA